MHAAMLGSRESGGWRVAIAAGGLEGKPDKSGGEQEGCRYKLAGERGDFRARLMMRRTGHFTALHEIERHSQPARPRRTDRAILPENGKRFVTPCAETGLRRQPSHRMTTTPAAIRAAPTTSRAGMLSSSRRRETM